MIADLYINDFPEVKEHRDEVITVLVKEEKAFRQTLRKGLKELEKFASNTLTGDELFTLYDTYGFPVELSTEEAFKQGISVSEAWRQEFDAKMEEQRNRSRTATKGEFKGGLGGQDLIHKSTTRQRTYYSRHYVRFLGQSCASTAVISPKSACVLTLTLIIK